MILASHSLENVLQPHGNILHPGSWEATHHLVVSFAARESSVWTPNYLVPFHYRSPKHHPSLVSLRANHTVPETLLLLLPSERSSTCYSPTVFKQHTLLRGTSTGEPCTILPYFTQVLPLPVLVVTPVPIACTWSMTISLKLLRVNFSASLIFLSASNSSSSFLTRSVRS